MAVDSLQWKSRPIFISSTFRDMHVERDYLRHHAFLSLGDELRKRAHYLDTIDLRQGVEVAGERGAGQAAAEARELAVLSVCLVEIERSKPFLVALLGDRYGYMPKEKLMLATAERAGMSKSVEVAGKSVTELEILYGVLANPDQRRRSWFYFRTIDRTGMPNEWQARFPAEDKSDDPKSPAGKLAALKARIKRELPDRWRPYTLSWDAKTNSMAGLDALNAMVERDLAGDLEEETKEFLRDAPRTWQKAEARAVADFVSERIRGYVPRPAVTDPMLAHAMSPTSAEATWGVVVTGESGAGKSSLFGTTFEALTERADKGELLLLAHAAGISPTSGQVDRMLRRFITELCALLGEEDVIEQRSAAAVEARGLQERGESKTAPTSQDIEETFAALLWRATQQKRVVVLLDALNQFEPSVRAEHLTWLPKAWPPNARLLATAIPGSASTALVGKAGCEEQRVPKVSRGEATVIADRFYKERYHHDVNEKVLDALLKKEVSDGVASHGNPLWLALALQEMNFLEADDFERAERDFAELPAGDRVQALQLAEATRLPGDAPGMYRELIARAGRNFDKAVTHATLELIALGRAGWRESDLRACVPVVSGQAWDDLSFAGLRRVLGTHLVRRGAHDQWDFFHAALRETLVQENLADARKRQRLHGVVAEHLGDLPSVDPLRQSERMYHLITANDSLGAAALYSGSLEAGELDGATRALADFIAEDAEEESPSMAEEWALRQKDASNVWPLGRKKANPALEWVLRLRAQCDEPDALRNLCRRWRLHLNPALRVKTPNWVRCRVAEGTLQGCEELGRREPGNSDDARDLANSYSELGDLKAALGQWEVARELAERARSILEALWRNAPDNVDLSRDLSENYFQLGDLEGAFGDPHVARELFEKARNIHEDLLRRAPDNIAYARDLAVNYHRLGRIEWTLGDLTATRTWFEHYRDKSEDLRRRAPDNVDYALQLAGSYDSLGNLEMDLGDSEAARPWFEKDLAISEELRRRAPDDADYASSLAISYARLGDLEMRLGDPAAALRHYQRQSELLEDLERHLPHYQLQHGVPNFEIRAILQDRIAATEKLVREAWRRT